MHMKADSRDLPGFHEKLLSGEHLSKTEAAELFDLLRNERDPGPIASLLTAWTAKGYSSGEIAACASILRKEVRRVRCSHKRFIDVVGTGGSPVKTFNVSTAAALVASGAGLAVAKHGNRAASSVTGSADALSELGVKLIDDEAAAGNCLDKHGICFMFAPHFHNLTIEIATARRSVGIPTIFNLLGPIANPAGAPFQLIGIWDGTKAEVYGEALKTLGTKRSWIVHGTDGLDEITLSGETEVTEVTGVGITQFRISPADFGLEKGSIDGLRARDAAASAETVEGVIQGTDRGAARDLVLINAAAALYIAGTARSLEDGLALASESIDSGSAAAKLRALVEETNR